MGLRLKTQVTTCHGFGDPATIHSDTETRGLPSPVLDQVWDLAFRS